MTAETLRLLERVHGHLGWLAVAALAHPAIVLRRRRRARMSVALSTLLVTTTVALGAVVYGPYSRHVRRQVYLASVQVGLQFERKEHLAVVAVALAWAGCALHFAELAGPLGERRARTAHLALSASAVLCAVVAGLGTRVAAFLSFP